MFTRRHPEKKRPRTPIGVVQGNGVGRGAGVVLATRKTNRSNIPKDMYSSNLLDVNTKKKTAGVCAVGGYRVPIVE